MIKKLRLRFILITMACISFIFLLILLSLNILMTVSSRERGYDVLAEHINRMEQSNVSPAFSQENSFTSDENLPGRSEEHPHGPGSRRNEWFDDMRIFSVHYNKEGEAAEVSTGENPNLTESSLLALAQTVMENPKERGRVSGYLYMYRSSENGASVYFLDYGPERAMSMQLWQVCLWISLAGILVILILVIFLSRWVVKPVQLAFDKQKQFIADASHELKTPLTIITTNAEVLESSLPGNKWLGYILEQSGRMRILINSLLELARLDANNEANPFYVFDLSKTIRNSALSFESLAYEYGKKYTLEITEGLSLYGNEENIKQLVTILLDNAFKYSDDKGAITITLSRHGDKKLLLVRNTGKGIDTKEQKHIFERFYRSDSSRSRQSGGYGLGLAIAESIVTAHKGHISVKSDGKSYTEFSVLLP